MTALSVTVAEEAVRLQLSAMSTGEGPDVSGDARDDREDRGESGHRGERIGVGGGDDSVIRIQLAARWAESFGPTTDSLGNILRRFRAAYEYLDAVTHGVEPPDLDREVASTRPAAQPVPAPAYAPPAEAGAPSSSSSPSPAAPQPETPRPWG